MATNTESARLRVVGQELEQRGISDFEVLVEEGGYRARGCLRPDVQPVASKAPRKLRDFFAAKSESVAPPPCPEVEMWEGTYSQSDIERLDSWHKEQRTRSAMPDDYATSQVLRVVGAYVEQRNWVLVAVSRTREMIEIRHRDASGELQAWGHKYAELYDFCFHMSRARKAEAALA